MKLFVLIRIYDNGCHDDIKENTPIVFLDRPAAEKEFRKQCNEELNVDYYSEDIDYTNLEAEIVGNDDSFTRIKVYEVEVKS